MRAYEIITENFADGKNPQDKGDSKRHGVPTKSSISTLRKVAKQGGRKGQLAHWMANMKSGKAKNEDQDMEESLIGPLLPWPEIVNKISSVMKSMGWKVHRKDDGTYMFTTQGQEDAEQLYSVIIESEGSGMFTYAIGAVEAGRADIWTHETVPNTDAGISELMNAIRDDYELNEG